MDQFDQLIEKIEAKLSKSFSQNIARGITRKKQNQVPERWKAKPFLKNYRLKSKSSPMIAKRAKKAPKGTWKVSPQQATDMGAKYRFNVPGKQGRKNLGSTGITLTAKNGEYYLSK